MAKQLTVNEQAKVGNDDLTATLQFVKVGDDGYGGAIKELSFALHIQHASGTSSHGRVLVDDVLTAQERSDLNPLLVKLRDAVLAAKGYIDV